MKKKLINLVGSCHFLKISHINQETLFPLKEISRITKRKLPYENASIRKRIQLEANTSEKRLKELPEIYTEIPADQAEKI